MRYLERAVLNVQPSDFERPAGNRQRQGSKRAWPRGLTAQRAEHGGTNRTGLSKGRVKKNSSGCRAINRRVSKNRNYQQGISRRLRFPYW